MYIIFFTIRYTSSPLVVVARLSADEAIQVSEIGQANTRLASDQGELAGSNMALVTLGCGLLGQAVLTIRVLCTTEVPTWGSRPIDAALMQCRQGTSGQQTRITYSVKTSIVQRLLPAPLLPAPLLRRPSCPHPYPP